MKLFLTLLVIASSFGLKYITSKYNKKTKYNNIALKHTKLSFLSLPELHHENIYSLMRTLDKPTKHLDKQLNENDEKELYPWSHIKTNHFILYNYKIFNEIRKTQKPSAEIIEITSDDLNHLIAESEKFLENSWGGQKQNFTCLFKHNDKYYAIK